MTNMVVIMKMMMTCRLPMIHLNDDDGNDDGGDDAYDDNIVQCTGCQ